MHAMRTVSPALFVAASSLALMACGARVGPVVGVLPGPALAIPRGNPVEADIEQGYRLYGATLQRWGRWYNDPLYAVHWCPRGVDPSEFVPTSLGSGNHPGG